jgi:hypothetical protein
MLIPIDIFLWIMGVFSFVWLYNSLSIKLQSFQKEQTPYVKTPIDNMMKQVFPQPPVKYNNREGFFVETWEQHYKRKSGISRTVPNKPNKRIPDYSE